MPKVEYLNNPSMELISASFQDMRPLNDQLHSENGRMPCRKVKIISQNYKKFNPAMRLKSRDIAVIAAGTHRRLKSIINYSKSLEDGSIGGIILTCATDDYPDSLTVEILSQTDIPVFSVQIDTAETDQVLYKCFRDTKIQLYDTKKHEMIVNLFENHFDAKRFIDSSVNF